MQLKALPNFFPDDDEEIFIYQKTKEFMQIRISQENVQLLSFVRLYSLVNI